MTTLYLGLSGNGVRDRRGLVGSKLGAFASFAAFDDHKRVLDVVPFWALDSGAFSVHTGKFSTTVNAFADFVAEVRASERPPREVFLLDVIGDWRASLANYRALARLNCTGIPTWHIGDPEEDLVTLARDYEKIAIGGIAMFRPATKRAAFLKQVFARIWPKRVHGFGVIDRACLEAVPFHSVDATSWQAGPTRFGRWTSYGGFASIPNKHADLTTERRTYERLAAEITARWRVELATLEQVKT